MDKKSNLPTQDAIITTEDKSIQFDEESLIEGAEKLNDEQFSFDEFMADIQRSSPLIGREYYDISLVLTNRLVSSSTELKISGFLKHLEKREKACMKIQILTKMYEALQVFKYLSQEQQVYIKEFAGKDNNSIEIDKAMKVSECNISSIFEEKKEHCVLELKLVI